jgi:excisionase family DNA binding protein
MNRREPQDYDETRSESHAALEPLLDIEAVSSLLGVSRPTVYRLIRAGELRVVHVRTRKRFRPDDLRGFIEAGVYLGPDKGVAHGDEPKQ